MDPNHTGSRFTQWPAVFAEFSVENAHFLAAGRQSGVGATFVVATRGAVQVAEHVFQVAVENEEGFPDL